MSADGALDGSKERNDAAFERAQRAVNVIDSLGFIAFFWVYVYPAPYNYAMLFALTVPLIAICAIRFSKGMIRLNVLEDSGFPSTIFAILLPSIAVIVTEITETNMLSYSSPQFWLFICAVTAALLLFLLVKQHEFSPSPRPISSIYFGSQPGKGISQKNKLLAAIATAVVIFVYATSSAFFLNTWLDSEAPSIFRAELLLKEESSDDYMFTIAAWGPFSSEKTLSVHPAVIDHYSEGEEVDIYVFPGFFHLPWYGISY